jgi:hypothetical protein
MTFFNLHNTSNTTHMWKSITFWVEFDTKEGKTKQHGRSTILMQGKTFYSSITSLLKTTPREEGKWEAGEKGKKTREGREGEAEGRYENNLRQGERGDEW